jgi:ankyrin repeat protein
VCRFILRQGANPANSDRAGRTALHYTCAAGLPALLDDLLAAAAAADSPDRAPETVTDSGEQGAAPPVLNESSLLAADRSGLAPIHSACRWGKLECVRALCSTQPESLNVLVTAAASSDDPAVTSAISAAVATAGVSEGDAALCVAVRAPDETDAVEVALYLCEEGGDGQVRSMLLHVRRSIDFSTGFPLNSQ